MNQVVWRKTLIAIAAMAIMACAVSAAKADGNAPAAAPAATPAATDGAKRTVEFDSTFDFEKWCKSMKEPIDWFCWGADYQYRAYYQNNQALNKHQPGHERIADRNRARIWGTFTVTEDIEINSRFMWSWFDNWEPSSAESTTLSEGKFDNMNVKFKNLFEKPGSSLTVGRQDIFLGDGWLVADGTPFDGSLTGFFDAARLTYEFENSPTTADLIFIDNHSSSEYWLHPIDSVPFPNAEQDEQGAIAYFTNKCIENTDISPYFMYKNADAKNYNFNGAHPDNGYTADLYTPGIRVTHKFDENWRVRGEGAYQFGSSDKGGNGRADVSAFGANGAVQYFTNDTMNNNFRLQYEFLSGDDTDSAQYEGFDTLWGRWARYSDIYANVSALDQNGRAGDYTNLHRIGPGWTFSPCDKVEIASDYYLLFANQSQGDSRIGTTASRTSDNGLFRGQLITSVLTYKFNKHISGHLQGELLFPGNYYSTNNNDIASFVRYQLVLTF